MEVQANGDRGLLQCAKEIAALRMWPINVMALWLIYELGSEYFLTLD
jgi:hypothetical protein